MLFIKEKKDKDEKIIKFFRKRKYKFYIRKKLIIESFLF